MNKKRIELIAFNIPFSNIIHAPTGNRTQGKCLEGIYVTTTPSALESLSVNHFIIYFTKIHTQIITQERRSTSNYHMDQHRIMDMMFKV